MKINVLQIIENDLIGGREGENCFIENNPLVASIYRDWKYKNQQKNFSDFLSEVLALKEDKTPDSESLGYKTLTKSYVITNSENEWKEYKKIEQEIDRITNEKNKILRKLAESKNKILADISKYEIKYNQYNKTIVFSFSVEQVMKERED